MFLSSLSLPGPSCLFCALASRLLAASPFPDALFSLLFLRGLDFDLCLYGMIFPVPSFPSDLHQPFTSSHFCPSVCLEFEFLTKMVSVSPNAS